MKKNTQLGKRMVNTGVRALAREINCDPSDLSKFLSGKRKPFKRVAKILKNKGIAVAAM
jgi:hypothetical protein